MQGLLMEKPNGCFPHGKLGEKEQEPGRAVLQGNVPFTTGERAQRKLSF